MRKKVRRLKLFKYLSDFFLICHFNPDSDAHIKTHIICFNLAFSQKVYELKV